MKILCVADQIDPLVYSAGIKERFGDVELVLSAGDLPMEYLGYIASMLNKPVVFVFGNHQLAGLASFRREKSPLVSDHSQFHTTNAFMLNTYGSTYTGGKVMRVKGLLIAGMGGSMWYNGGPNQYTDFQMNMKLIRLIPRLLWNRIVHGRYLDLLLTHAPPFGIHDQHDLCHTGFSGFLWFVRLFRPAYLIHGHIHLYDLNATRRTRYLHTTVINVYSHYLLDVSDVRGTEDAADTGEKPQE